LLWLTEYRASSSSTLGNLADASSSLASLLGAVMGVSCGLTAAVDSITGVENPGISGLWSSKDIPCGELVP